jgi:ribosomal protein L11 methyltransferase
MKIQYLWQRQATKEWWLAHETMLLAWYTERVAVIERPGRKRFAVEISCRTRREAAKLIRDFGGKSQRTPHITQNSCSKPIKIGARLVVTNRRSGTKFPSRKLLIIPAAGAFGTGEHATTAMCLRSMERVTRRWPPGWSMLDAGTGSGILALAAKCFGADHVTAIDNDPKAIAIAKSNARVNRIRGIRFEIADARSANTRGKVGVIAANLFSELLSAAIPKWRPRWKSGGILIVSGILRPQERGVVRALRKQKIAIEEIRRRGKWIAIVARNQKAG